jgi:hypothetical protein
MVLTNRSLFVAAITFSSPAFAGPGYMGIPTGMSFGGILLGLLLFVVVSTVALTVAAAAYEFLKYIVGKIRARK